MKRGAPGPFAAQLKALREAAGFTQEELATIAGLSVHAVSALERGERRSPHVETVRALSAALDLTGPTLQAFVASARTKAHTPAVDNLSGVALPLPPTALLGRETEMQTLRRWLAEPAARLITLIGPGGVGKTRLALEVAREIADEGSIAVRFASLGTIRDATVVAPAIADALGLSDVSAAELPGRVGVICRDSPTLLVLDNLEHVLEAASLVADLLTSAPPLRVLATSRAPLRVRGEREYTVEPLALTIQSDATPADLARVPAVRFFLERVRQARPDFRLTPANGPAVAEICRRLDALPLALELAAPWLKTLTPEALLGRLTQDALPAGHTPRDLPERQQTMNATVAWSYRLLDAEEQRAFRCFGALSGSFPIEAAAAVLAGRDGTSTEPALHSVGALIDKSLMLRVGGAAATARPLYRMLETVRAYAALELTAARERDDALVGLARYGVVTAALAAERLIGPAQAEWLMRVHDDVGTYRTALTWLVAHGRAADACEIASGLTWFWVIRGQAEGLQWYEQILNLPSLAPAVEARMLVGAALMSFNQGDLSRARSALTRARSLAQGADDAETAMRAEDLSGRVEHASGNVYAAVDCFRRAIEGFEAHGIAWAAGNGLIGLARVVLAMGDGDQAERLLDQAATKLSHAGPWFQSRTLYVRALLAVRRGHADEAIAFARDSLTYITEIRDKYALAFLLVPLAAAAVMRGEDLWAARILGARDAASERTGATIVLKLVHDLQRETEQNLQARLGAARWAQAYAVGRRSSIDAMLTDIDGALSRTV